MAVLLPTLAVKHVTDITPEMLHVMKVKGMILDVDNTLSRHGCPIPFEGSIEWTHEMRAAGIKVIIVSLTKSLFSMHGVTKVLFWAHSLT